MKPRLRRVLLLILAAVIVQGLVNCTPEKGRNSGLGQTELGVRPGFAGTRSDVGSQAGSRVGAPLGPIASGTSDTGGGTGTQGKVYDQYIKDPFTLEAYKKFVLPRLQNIKRTENGFFHEMMFKLKPWYFIPERLEKKTKESVGVTHLKGTTSQIALNHQNRITVDLDLYNNPRFENPELPKLTPEEILETQGYTLTHEFVMTLFMLKFMPVSQLCKVMETIDSKMNEGSNCGEIVLMDKMMPAEAWREPSPEENENIRYVTEWFIRNAAQPIQESVLMKLLVNKGFDTRYFGSSIEGPSSNKAVKISGQDFENLMKTHQAAGRLPKTCSDAKGLKSAPCQISFVPNKTKLGEFDIRAFNLHVAFQDGHKIETQFVTTDEIEMAQDETTGAMRFSHSFWNVLPKIEIGQNFYEIRFIFRQSEDLKLEGLEPRLELDSIVLRSSVISSINPKRNVICMGEKVKNPDWRQEVIVALSAPDQKLTSIERFHAILSPSIAPCDPRSFSK